MINFFPSLPSPFLSFLYSSPPSLKTHLRVVADAPLHLIPLVPLDLELQRWVQASLVVVVVVGPHARRLAGPPRALCPARPARRAAAERGAGEPKSRGPRRRAEQGDGVVLLAFGLVLVPVLVLRRADGLGDGRG